MSDRPDPNPLVEARKQAEDALEVLMTNPKDLVKTARELQMELRDPDRPDARCNIDDVIEGLTDALEAQEKEIGQLREFAGSELYMSDFRTAPDMREEIERLTAERDDGQMAARGLDATNRALREKLEMAENVIKDVQLAAIKARSEAKIDYIVSSCSLALRALDDFREQVRSTIADSKEIVDALDGDGVDVPTPLEEGRALGDEARAKVAKMAKCLRRTDDAGDGEGEER